MSREVFRPILFVSEGGRAAIEDLFGDSTDKTFRVRDSYSYSPPRREGEYLISAEEMLQWLNVRQPSATSRMTRQSD
jgi:hypothetical protein